MKKSDIDLPSTLERSPAKAQHLYAETLRSAEEQYGPGERASRTAWAAVKHQFHKVEDHWEAGGAPGGGGDAGPDDGDGGGAGSPGGGAGGGRDRDSDPPGGDRRGPSRGMSRDALYDEARRLGIPRRSAMNKAELEEAVAEYRRR